VYFDESRDWWSLYSTTSFIGSLCVITVCPYRRPIDTWKKYSKWFAPFESGVSAQLESGWSLRHKCPFMTTQADIAQVNGFESYTNSVRYEPRLRYNFFETTSCMVQLRARYQFKLDV
jgi:hypothetical protein